MPEPSRPESDVTARPLLTRRGFLGGTLAAVAVGAVGACRPPGPPPDPSTAPRPPRVPVHTGRWSDPSTWGGSLPTPGDHVILEKPVLLDVNAAVASLEVLEPGSLEFDPGASAALASAGNVIIRGRLALRPDAADIVHRLVFVGVDERYYVGGGMDPVSSDVGLWVVDGGLLEADGAPKRAWTRAAGSVRAGSRGVELAESPTGWRVGDEIVITPTVEPTVTEHQDANDLCTITAISGRVVMLDRPTTHEHPAVTVSPGRTLAAEVLNLTRNVRIEGTSGGRAHVLIRSTGTQKIRYTQLRHLGPRQASKEGGTDGVLGRYMLHFHHCGEGSRGTAVEGVVAREGGGHAFVPHMSHGITMRDCISHDTYDEAYWWDHGHITNDLTWDRCVASWNVPGRYWEGFRLTGFSLGRGENLTARECVAVGVVGNAQASGFHWPEGHEGSWTFVDNLAHNNRCFGIFTWQNTWQEHVIERFTAYHCGGGINHGAYLNRFEYRDCTLYGNSGKDRGEAGVLLHAKSDPNRTLGFSDTVIDAAGLADHGVVDIQHSVGSPRPVVFERVDFRGHKHSAFRMLKSSTPGLHEFRDCTFDGNEFWLENDVHPESLVRVIHDGQTLELRRRDQSGAFRPEWNASVTSV